MESDLKPGSVPCVYFKWEVVVKEDMGNENGKGEEPEGRLGELCRGRKQSLRSNVGRELENGREPQKWKSQQNVEREKRERSHLEERSNFSGCCCRAAPRCRPLCCSRVNLSFCHYPYHRFLSRELSIIGLECLSFACSCSGSWRPMWRLGFWWGASLKQSFSQC